MAAQKKAKTMISSTVNFMKNTGGTFLRQQ